MTDQNKKHILYIDDDDDDRQLVKEAILEIDHSLQLMEAPGGNEGLEFLKKAAQDKNLPCLVILDMNMPGMDGRETLIAIKNEKKYAKIPVVIFTTSSSKLDQTFCEKYGVEMITKPLNFSNLNTTIRKMLIYCHP